jgi:hypothetical protein
MRHVSQALLTPDGDDDARTGLRSGRAYIAAQPALWPDPVLGRAEALYGSGFVGLRAPMAWVAN